MEIRRSYDRLISAMGFPIRVIRHLYIDIGPWSVRQCHIMALTTVKNWSLMSCQLLINKIDEYCVVHYSHALFHHYHFIIIIKCHSRLDLYQLYRQIESKMLCDVSVYYNTTMSISIVSIVVPFPWQGHRLIEILGMFQMSPRAPFTDID